MSEEWDPAGGDAEWDGGAAESTGVHEDEALEAVGMGSGTAHSDGSAPVVCEEGDILEIEELDELAEAVDVVLECVECWLLRFLGEAAAEVIDGDHAKGLAEGGNEFSPGEAPGWITVDHQEGRSGAFVEVDRKSVV